MPKQTKSVAYQDEAQAKIASGLTKLADLATAAYGPKSGNVMLEVSYGSPTISRDGVTNVKNIYLEDPIENMAVQIAKQAAEQNNKKVGDGTTAVVILAHYLYTEARKLLAAGHNQMKIAGILEDTAQIVISQINQLKKPVDAALLQQVAIVSSGDPAIGEMIADVVDEVGVEGGITVEEYQGIGILNEIVEGFYFNKGWTNINLINDPTNLESRHESVMLLITEKRLATSADIVPILEKIVKANIRELIIIGEVSEEALNVLLLNKLKGIIACTVSDLPVYFGSRSLMLEDLATITGGKVLTAGNGSDFDIEMLGAAQKVVVNEWSTTIIGADGAEEDVTVRLNTLRDQLKEAVVPATITAINDRLAKLTGKVAIIRVGGATEVERKEVKLRVEDAICAVRAAIKDGIVPGGGVTLARIATPELPFYAAYKEPFKQLAKNAGLNPEHYLSKVESARDWYGFDLKNISDKPKNLLTAGIVDPALVLKEVVQNATSVAANLIKVNAAVTYTDREIKND